MLMRNVSKYLRRNAVRIALSRECVLHRAAAESSNEDECRALEGRDKLGKMSGARPKRGMVPERPSQKKEPARASTADETPRDSAESSPALTDRPFLEGRAPVSGQFASFEHVRGAAHLEFPSRVSGFCKPRPPFRVIIRGHGWSAMPSPSLLIIALCYGSSLYYVL